MTTRGGSQELFVECYVPRFKIYRLRPGEDIAITGQGEIPTIRMSLRASARDFLVELGRVFHVSPPAARYWRTEVASGMDIGVDYPAGRLSSSGAEPFDVSDTDLDKAIGDLLVNPSDEFVVEIKENDKWVIDVEQFHQRQRQQPETSVTASVPNGLTASAEASGSLKPGDQQPLFKSGGFFGEMSNRMGIASSNGTSHGSGTASSSTLKPPANIAGRSKPTPGLRTPGTLGLSNLCVYLLPWPCKL